MASDFLVAILKLKYNEAKLLKFWEKIILAYCFRAYQAVA